MDEADRDPMSREEVALAGWRAGKALREIAVELYGRERTEACWGADSPIRSELRRLLAKAVARSGAGPGGGGEAKERIE